jgi:hypothetical protein
MSQQHSAIAIQEEGRLDLALQGFLANLRACDALLHVTAQ